MSEILKIGARKKQFLAAVKVVKTYKNLCSTLRIRPIVFEYIKIAAAIICAASSIDPIYLICKNWSE
jgi:hypothetical protein